MNQLYGGPNGWGTSWKGGGGMGLVGAWQGDELPGKGSSWLWGRVDWEKTPILMKARFVSNAEETAEKALKSSTITPEGQVIIMN